ncbi:MAG: SH3 domain-containing protein [Deltaproteobacteria bacterium]|nr:SH3 domain-containing protein [Deltaproteobacteria bacterium]
MSRWMVNVRGNSFSAGSMDELKALAKKGELGGGDIVQPPGAQEWLYAVEIPELKTSIRVDPMDGLDLPQEQSSGVSPIVKGIAAGLMALVSIGLWGYALSVKNSMPQAEQLELIGKHGLSFSEVLVTGTGVELQADATGSSGVVASLPRNKKAELLAKRGNWYKLRYDGKEGYAPVESVIPAYYFADERTKLDYDPLYNPDKYVYVMNSSWMLPAESKQKNASIMSFMLQNDSKFGMTDLRIVAVLKDGTGGVLEQKEVPVEGVMAANRSEMVGTLLPASKNEQPRVMLTSDMMKLAETDDKVASRWLDGVEVILSSAQVAEASVTLVEVRAVPPES